MSNTGILPLQNDGSGARDALALKKFSMEVMSAFERLENNDDLHTVKTLGPGESVIQFPVIGRVVASYHTPGERMRGQNTKQTERRMIVDRYLVSPIEIYKLDDKFSHYDYRSPYVEKMARSIELLYQNHILQTACIAAFDVSEGDEYTNKGYEGSTVDAVNVLDAGGGDVTSVDPDNPTADEILAWVNALELRMDDRYIPEEGRVVLLKPKDFQTFRQAYAAQGAYFRTGANEVDSLAVRMAMSEFEFGTVRVRKSYALKHITESTYFTDGDQEARRGKRYTETSPSPTFTATGGMTHADPYYNAEIAEVKAIALTPEAVMTGRFESLETEADYEVREKQTFLVSSLGAAHGVLNPDTAIVVKTT